MTDKEKIREEVERLKSNLVYGACASQVAMENRCKEEAYDEVLAILDTMQEKPVSIWHDASTPPNDKNAGRDIYIVTRNQNNRLETWHIFSYMTWEWVEGHVDGKVVSWAYLKDLLNLTHSELTKISDHVEPVSEELKKAEKEWLTPQLDKSYAEYGETKMMELTHFDGYAMLAGMEKMKEEMMKGAVEGEISTTDYGKTLILRSEQQIKSNFYQFDKVKLIIIKED